MSYPGLVSGEEGSTFTPAPVQTFTRDPFFTCESFKRSGAGVYRRGQSGMFFLKRENSA